MATTSSPGGQPKTLSSRLLTMKFMQRAAASPSTEPTTEEPSPKRRRTERAQASKFDVSSLADSRAVQVAFAEEKAKKQAALDKQAAEAGDSRWVLNFETGRDISAQSTFRIVQTGFASLDTSLPQKSHIGDNATGDDTVVGRRSFGHFNRIIEKKQHRSDTSGPGLQDEDRKAHGYSSEASSDSKADLDGDDDDPSATSSGATHKLLILKEQRSAKRKADVAEPQELAKKRRKKEVKLNGPGRTSLTGRQDRQEKKCMRCGGSHSTKRCPEFEGRAKGDHRPAQVPRSYGRPDSSRKGPMI